MGGARTSSIGTRTHEVERSHRIDAEEFYALLDGLVVDDAKVFNNKLREWEDYYNYYRPHGGLNGRTPSMMTSTDTSLSTPAATQILSATHGFVLLAMTGFIEAQGLQDVMAPMAVNLLVGFGDTRRRAERSLAAAIKARAPHL